ncbi:MAG: tRNA (adenosine(37)-N6)-dimethylallyltransferase MiaA [Clostridia bacterium]|nr:tRNA (adenosine(37)-N6)-dimethylallyltransferase MiaA [Clostridia bacterium]MBQ6525378.1 tRNA (adenosine(37)-N6)-dimethylallyltransferase MiaA [Clostridia bacterium]
MSNTERIPLVAVVGPTASGKTALAVELAKALDGEVLSFDSMQLYKGMDVATAKPTADEMQGIPHHLIDVVDPSETYSVARFQEDAARIIADIRGRGKNVILVGGTGLYLDSFIENLQFLDTGDNTEVRARLRAELEASGPEAMYARLQSIDPAYAEAVHPNNTGRVLRALEVYELTGYTMTDQIARSRREPGRYDVVYIGLTAEDRDYLYDRINQRVDRMIENGLLDEARQWLRERPGATAAQAIGIKEMLPYLQGEDTLEHCAEQLKTDTRHYAKRQLTWFRRNPDVHWLYIDQTPDLRTLTAEALAIIEEEGIL